MVAIVTLFKAAIFMVAAVVFTAVGAVVALTQGWF